MSSLNNLRRTVLEKFEECENIYNKYSDDSTFMLFPLSIMYYKKGDYRKSKKILKSIKENNEYILGYLKHLFHPTYITHTAVNNISFKINKPARRIYIVCKTSVKA